MVGTKWIWRLLHVFGILLAIFLILPSLIVVPISFSDSALLKFPPQGFSLRWYVSFFESPAWTDALLLSCMIGIGTMLVAVPLAATTFRVANESYAELQAKRFAQQWLAETDFEVNRIEADNKQIEITISGSGDPPPLPDLGTHLETTVDKDVKVKLKVVPSRQLLFPELESD